MQVARRETLEEYFKYLHEHPEESQALLTDLLISVTAFFRDTKAFEALAKHVIAALVKDELHSPIRVWSAGCATGEEAYSIAMLLLEEAARHEFRPEIQVFGSDMDNRALAIAREGRYPSAIEADVSEERLRRFFTPDGDSYRVKRELRDVMLFANHSLLKDPPFSRLDLIACRNLLIYLDRDLQQQVLTTLQYGLKSDGFLFLGSSESAEHPDGLFHTIDRDARIYQSTGRSSEKLPALPRLAGTGALERIASVAPTHLSARSSQNAHREALEVAAPPSILVDETYRVLHLSESAGRYLQPPGGPLSTDVTDLVRPAMRFELRALLAKAFQNQEPVLSSAMFVQFNGHPNRVYLHVKPVITRDDDKEVKRALIVFVEGDVEKHLSTAEATVVSDATNGTVERLRHELEITQSRLRTTREESESANEELRAANEELQSINEEYRSTAEELETSKEELQSINEELQTVNSELKLKLETVSRANSDLQNLMAAMDFGTLFLDSNLRIKRFTPRLTDLFSLTLADVGRPITDFTHQLDYDGLVSDARTVLQHLTPIERAITSRSGNWYLARYRPYRTTDDKIDGVVATFVDVSERRAMESALRASEAKLRQEMRLVEISRAPIFVWDFDDGILQWNRGCEELYGYTRDEALGKVKEKLLQTEVPGSSFQAIREALLKDGFWHGEINQITKDGRSLTVESQIELLKDAGRRYVLESTRDITQSKALKARQQLLLGELTHRVKNTLAVVQAMVRQTWRNSPTGDDFIERLEGRIGALAEAHKLLVDSNWHGADLSALVTSQLRAYATENPSRLQMEGPPVTLAPEIATPFGLVLHELATNAVKHGALAAEKGTIALKWEVLERNSEHVVRIIWQEKGGPQVREPKKTSFGTRLIKQGIPGATVEYAFEPAGVRCIIEFPLRGTEQDGEGV
jgi:two-component system CheB/CheR fusion protein